MTVPDYLSFLEEPSRLRRPVVIMAFSGWNDAAESATTAARFLTQVWPSRAFASIDPEEFYHFGLSRPQVRFKPDSNEREKFLTFVGAHRTPRIGAHWAHLLHPLVQDQTVASGAIRRTMRKSSRACTRDHADSA